MTQPAPRLLGRDDILAADDLPSEDVDVPEWSGTVRVRGLSGRGRDEYLTSLLVVRGAQIVGRDPRNASARLVAQCIIDPETGSPAFTLHDVDKLGEKSAAGLARVYEVAARLSGLEGDAVKKLGEDSEPTRSGGSISG